jgi:hypothetical protein
LLSTRLPRPAYGDLFISALSTPSSPCQNPYFWQGRNCGGWGRGFSER